VTEINPHNLLWGLNRRTT